MVEKGGREERECRINGKRGKTIGEKNDGREDNGHRET